MAQVWRPEKMDFHFEDMFHAFITVFGHHHFIVHGAGWAA
jgi:hypothetical protein